MIAAFARRDTRVRILPGGDNMGQRMRLRQLLAAAGGAHVAIADQDDVWDPSRNRLLLAAIGERPLAFGPSQLIDGQGDALGPTLLDTLGLTPDPAAVLRTLFKPMVSAHAAIVRRDWIDAAIWGNFMPFDWLMGAAALHDGGIAYVPDAVVRHRIHGANQMNRAAPDRTRRLGGLRNRFAAMLRRPTQLRLTMMLDFLGRTTMVAPDRRAAFARLAEACRNGWFGAPWPRVQDSALRAQLLAVLSPLAGSDADLAIARRQIDLLTRSLIHPAKAAEAIRRSWTPLEADL